MATAPTPVSVNWATVFGANNPAAQMLNDLPFSTFEALQTAPLDEQVAQLEQQIQALQTQQQAWGTLQGDANAFAQQIQALGLPTSWQGMTATANNPSVATAAASSTAVAGSYLITVAQLAQNEIDGAATDPALTSPSAALGALVSGWTAASLAFTVGGQTYTVAVTASTSLQGLAQAINALGAPVEALVAAGGSASSPVYYLELAATQPDQPIAYGGSSSTAAAADWYAVGVLSSTAPGSAPNVVQAAQPAIVDFGTSQVQSPTNTVTNVIPGVTLTLQAVGSTTITVADNVQGQAQAVQNAVQAFNQWAQDTFTLAVPTLPGATGTGGFAPNPKAVLTSALPIMALDAAATALSGVVVNGLSLAGVGITWSGASGVPQLTVNQTQLEAAIQANPSGVQALFAAAAQAVGPWASGFGQGPTSTGAAAQSALGQEIQQDQQRVAQLNQEVSAVERQARAAYEQWASTLVNLAEESNTLGAMLGASTALG